MLFTALRLCGFFSENINGRIRPRKGISGLQRNPMFGLKAMIPTVPHGVARATTAIGEHERSREVERAPRSATSSKSTSARVPLSTSVAAYLDSRVVSSRL